LTQLSYDKTGKKSILNFHHILIKKTAVSTKLQIADNSRKGIGDMDKVKKEVHYMCSDTINRKYAGNQVGVAVLDTGIVLHTDFRGRIKAFKDCINGRNMPYDDSGHGTHVAGILAGDGWMSKGVLAGMAPQANLYIVKVLNEKGEGDIRQILEGVRWVKSNSKKLGIRIVNLSVGAKSGIDREKEEWLLEAVEQLWDMGLVVVVSAGNQGPGEGTVAIPGTSRKVITVGASQEGKEAACSGRGPTGECVVKPDVMAPGYQIISCNNAPGSAGKFYTIKSGTSMATPVVSGAIAVLLSKYPDMSNVEVKMRLRQTCRKQPDGQTAGWGMLQVDRLLGSD